MTNKSLVKYEEKDYDKALVRNGSVLGLLDQLIELDGQKPYLEISSNKEIKSYFEKKGIDVTNKEELKSFYNYLENKIAELSDSSDERVKLYFEKREYLKQLKALPSNLSKLEQTVFSGFEELKVPFKAVMNYVWDAVMNHDFEMEEDGEKALEKYCGKIEIGKVLEEVWIYHKYEKFKFRLNLEKERRKEKTITTEKKFLFFKKEDKKTTYETEKSKEGDFFTSEMGAKDDNYWTDADSIEESIDNFKKNFNKSSEEKQKGYIGFIKNVLNLPKLMDNYVKRKQENLTKMFGELK